MKVEAVEIEGLGRLGSQEEEARGRAGSGEGGYPLHLEPRVVGRGGRRKMGWGDQKESGSHGNGPSL